jgi:hypothetical protein
MRAVRFYTKRDIRIEDVPEPSVPQIPHMAGATST